jgi:hypothetical protein
VATEAKDGDPKDQMMRWLIVGALLFFSAFPVKADVVNVDLSALPTIPGTGGFYIYQNPPFCDHSVCAGYEITPIYLLGSLSLPVNTTVNFGTIVVSNLSACAGCSWPGPSYSVAFDGATLPPMTGSPNLTIPLIFTLDGQTAVQFEYSTPASFDFAFADAVPEPSTWAMFLIGFAGLAYVGYRRRLSPANNSAR